MCLFACREGEDAHRSASLFAEKGQHKVLLDQLRDLLSRKSAWNKEQNDKVYRIITCVGSFLLTHQGALDLLAPRRGFIKLLTNVYSTSVKPLETIGPMVRGRGKGGEREAGGEGEAGGGKGGDAGERY